MRECLIVGKTHAGKTLFTVNFAHFLGLNTLSVTFRHPNGLVTTKTYSIAAARRELVGSVPHMTRALQSISLDLPVGKGVKRCLFTDTSGLIDHIHADGEIRRAIAQTLGAIREADLILHLVDTAAVGAKDTPTALGEVDYQVAQFAQMRGGYAILANKMDLPGAAAGLAKLRLELPGHHILPVSALYKRGFREVKEFVQRHL
ncbi:MAG TPA: GTP-binding protein HSR1 [Firmicutes bacterium]|nr:GTP-binding protein HSR1 [Bacillota bacterium]